MTRPLQTWLTSVLAIMAGVADSPVSAKPVENIGPSSRRTPFAISEIMYHPAQRSDGLDGEFIELYNSQPWDEDISGFRLDGAVTFEFPPSTVIEAYGYVIVAKAPSDLKEISGIDSAFGPFSGQLSNGSETLRLLNSQGAVLLEVPYEDTTPWPVKADGLGHSLVLARASLGESNPGAWNASSSIGGSPGFSDSLTEDSFGYIALNEIYGHPTEPGAGFVEIMNRSSEPVDLSGAVLMLSGSEPMFQFEDGILIQPSARLLVQESTLPFGLDMVEFVLGLRSADGSEIIDAARVAPHESGVSFGRTLDGSHSWQWLSQTTPGESNAPALRPPVIFNELMFHPISGKEEDEYIELFNRTDSPVDVGNWQIAGGVDFSIPSGRMIPAGGYLVIAKDAARLHDSYPQLDASNAVGNYSGRLSNSGESLTLMKPATFAIDDVFPPIEVDSARYRDSGRESEWADGGGSSLELRDPESDNNIPANWAASDESAKSEWTVIEGTADVESVAGLSPRSLQIQLLGAGEMLIDDVEVFNTGGTNKVRNADFETGRDWVFQGNHVRSTFEQNDNGNALHIRASGRGDPHSNRIRQTMQSGLSTSREATMRARVRWLRGHPEILLRTLGNHIEVFGRAGVPTNLGSPGLQNSMWTVNAAPTIENVQHSPVLPAPGESITVTANVRDTNGIGVVRLLYRNDSTGGDEAAIAMAASSGTTFQASVPGASSGQLIAFRVEAEDAADSPAASMFPPANVECLVRFGEDSPRAQFGDYRLWFTRATRNAWTSSSRARTSNETLSVTFVYNGERAIYDAGATFSGSFFNSPSYDTPTGNPCDYTCKFPGDDRFLGARRIILSWPGLTGEPDRTAQHEQFSYWLASEIGLPFNYRRYVGVTVNGIDRGVMEDTQRPNNDMLKQWFPGQTIEHFSKIQIRYEGNDRSNDIEAIGQATLEKRTDETGEKRVASYRWNWPSQLDGATANDFTGIFDLVEAVNTSNDEAYTRAVRAEIDIEQWMRIFAIEHAVGNWDSYGYGNGQNMYAAKPTGGKWNLMMWDLDIGSGSQSGDPADTDLFRLTNPFFPQVNGDRTIVRRMYQHPEFVRTFWRALEELATGPMTEERVEAIVDSKHTELRETFGTSIRTPSALKRFMRDRREFILNELNDEVSAEFAIQNLDDGRIQVDTNPAIIRGTAPVSVHHISINGVFYPVSWISPTEWRLAYPLFEAMTELLVQGIGPNGNAGPDSSINIVVDHTGRLDPQQPNLVLNEWMAINDRTLIDPADVEADDWLEIYNAGTTTVDLTGYTLTDDLEDPKKWSFPETAPLAPGGYLLVWLDSDVDQTPAGIELHASFSLNGNGEQIGLFAPDGSRMDAVAFGPQTPDVSMGRTPDGVRSVPVFLSSATPEAANVAAAVSEYRILGVQLLPGAESLRITWETEPGQAYLIQASVSLTPPGWQDANELIVAEERSLTHDLPISIADRFRYFRIKKTRD